MILAIAGFYWLALWVTAPPGTQSQLKLSYPKIEFIESIRHAFVLNAQGITADSKALVAGLAIGERDLLSAEVAEQMKTLSLTHLVAVSGANLAIIMGVCYLVSAGLSLSRNARYISALSVMVAYVLVVGPESSVLRAATMASFVAGGLWLGRGSNPIYALAWAIIFLLAIDPGLAVDFGFSLSALATLGLLTIAKPIYQWASRYVPKLVAVGLAASFSAQLVTTPILLMLQPSIPVYSVLANLIVEPVVAPVTVLGITALILAMPLPLISAAISYVASLGTWWITVVAANLSSWPAARVHFVAGPAGIVLAFIVVGLALSIYYQEFARYRVMLAVSLIGAVTISLSWSIVDQLRYQQFAGKWDVVNCDVGQGDALVIQSAGVTALIDVGREPEPIDRCLENLGVDQIDLLVITHFDADHAGGIHGALRNRQVSRAIISGFEDDRPLVSLIDQELNSANVLVYQGFAGMSGSLGDLQWKVLSPTANAWEAKDSNDASVIISFIGAEFSVLALGDLGEIGQQRLLRNSAAALRELTRKPLLLKVAHHGSADQSAELFRLLGPEVAIFSVGRNPYGHPTNKALTMARNYAGSSVRTDELGSIALWIENAGWKISAAGKLTA